MSSALEKKQAATQLSGFRISPLAGNPAPREMLVDLARLEQEYFDRKPDLEDANQLVVFGTSGHLRRNSTVWTTDKDGPIMDLLAAEITARTGKDPGVHYRELTAEFGTPLYKRIDAPASPDQKRKLQKLSPDSVKESELAGEPIVPKLTKSPGNHAPIGGLKVVARSGWFAARPSGTENIYKIYAESFKDESRLDAIIREAQDIVSNALDQS
jgi:phosphoglucomutase